MVISCISTAPLYVPFPDVLRDPQTTFEQITGVLFWPLTILPLTFKAWGGGVAAWMAYRSLFKFLGAPLRHASLICMNLFALGLILTILLILRHPEPFEAAVFLWSMDGLLPDSYAGAAMAIQNLDWITNAPLLSFFALCAFALLKGRPKSAN